MLEILTLIRDGVTKPTTIMYDAHLSYRPCQKFLSDLEENGLILVKNIDPKTGGRSRRKYHLTEHGADMLVAAQGLYDIL